MGTEFRPNYAVHVGIFLKDALEGYEMSQKELAEKIGVSTTIINEVIKGKRGMNTNLAILLEPVFGLPAKYWLDIQNDYVIASKKRDNTLIVDNDEIDTAEYSALEISYWFINYAGKNINDEWITALKLQKLLFFAQAIFLIQCNQALFRENILHWELGPVVREVYDKYKNNQREPIKSAPKTNIDSKTVDILKKVYKMYGKYSAGYLVELTHREIAWIETQKNEVLPLPLIRNTFSGFIG